MQVGMLTRPFEDEPLEEVLAIAEELQIHHLEVMAHPGSRHIDSAKLTAKRAAAIRDMLEERGMAISALAYYTDVLERGKIKRHQQALTKVIDAAALLGVDTVCALPGFAPPGVDKLMAIRELLPGFWKPVLQHARRKKVRLAMENYHKTCLQGLDTFEVLFKAIPDKHFGLNYDPSHLVHQGIDHLVPITAFGERIFHVHAKDTLIDEAAKARVGILGEGWWRYVIPGFGRIHWGEVVTHLRLNGYDSVLSIEHEDATQSREEGFLRGSLHLEPLC